jgi:hypothetical protein|tara:strand:- start:223 stop:741 length:519 start_codon:yes stop_codon:yes gene_type:complete
MKKAQITGQVFIYILSAMVFALVLVYGYKAIGDFLNRADQVAEIELSTDLKSSIKTIASSQDVKQKAISIPAKFKQICFIDLNKDAKTTNMCDITHGDYNLVICNFWDSNAEQNVFLLPNPSDVKVFVGEIEPREPDQTPLDYLCMNITNGKVKLKLQGLGDRTGISAWPQS